MRVFVSSQVVDRWPAATLIRALREAGAEVEHSPSNPLDRPGTDWGAWHGPAGVRAVVARCDAVVIAVEPGWDSSTWMGIEGDAALAWAAADPAARRVWFWNPDGVAVRAAGMLPYLRAELPRNLGETVVALLRDGGGAAPAPG